MFFGIGYASEEGVRLDKAPNRTNDFFALQRGAQLFVNHCLNCHGASMMRYNRLQDIGLTKEQIEKNLLFTADKVGQTMQVTIPIVSAKKWFGTAPPDLSVIARARGTDWLYTYLRSFYRDPSRPTGWNNLVFPNVGMPHVLWELSGERVLREREEKDPHDPSKIVRVPDGFDQVSPGVLTPIQYDEAIADLVSYMSWMAEPRQNERIQLGVGVLIFLLIFTILAWRLNAAYWKDIR
jgi:ubiquinol-cytochrome c reductase cytochrome c1 subunit